MRLNMTKKGKKILLLFVIIATGFATQVKAEYYQTNVDLKQSIKRSTYHALLSGREAVPETSYNLVTDVGGLTVKDQKTSKSCWAFSFSSMLEASLKKQHNKVSKDYSPMHLEYTTAKMFNRIKGSGGGPRLAVAYATSGKGPVEESQMPFESVYDETTKTFKEVENLEMPISARIKETKEFANIYKKMNEDEDEIEYYSDATFSKKYTQEEVDAIRTLIKQHIKTSGAISAEIHIDEENYYNTETAAYDYSEYSNDQKPNHVVTIVGWDDEYSIDNFKEYAGPAEDGAYIALNSYGDNWGKNGYMYISYEDAFIEQQLMGIVELEEYEDNKKDYDKIYQHDELGMNMEISLGNISSLYAANVYERDKNANQEEELQEVGLYIANTSGVEVYVNPDSDEIEKAKLVVTPSTPLETGYHTIKLPTPIKLTGDKFVIKVKYTNAEGASLPMEINYKSFGLQNTSDFYDKATASDGECFISNNGTDWNDVNKVTIDSKKLKDSSTCIKAFTTYTAATSNDKKIEKIEFNKTALQVKEGDKFNLEITFYPTDATNKKVTWKSSNEGVATVTQNGIITAVSAGQAIITATTEDGAKVANATVNVEAKTNTSDDNNDDSGNNNLDSNHNGSNASDSDDDEVYNDDDSDYNDDDDDIYFDDDDDYDYDDDDDDDSYFDDEDVTMSEAIMPKAGNTTMIMMAVGIIVLITIAIITYIKTRKLKDVK